MTAIMNPAAYERAREGAIRNNARRGREQRWLATGADARRCYDFLFEQGEFDRVDNGGETLDFHPVSKALHGSNFVAAMYEAVIQWGALTERQTAALIRTLDQTAQRIAERAAERERTRAQDAATSGHIGTVGERREFALTISFVAERETDFGRMFIHGLRDADGNTLLYKGSKRLGEKGAAVRVKATIKAHGDYQGVAQTVLTRPAVAA